jgi:transcriptional regulator with XRE-family HTH domain
MAKPSPFVTALRKGMSTAKLSQAELAKAVDCTPQYISQLLQGHRPPSSEFLERIAKALRSDPTKLDPSWQPPRRKAHQLMMPGIEIGYLNAALSALGAARTALLAQAPPTSLLPGAGKDDAKFFDAVAEHAIAQMLLGFNNRCAIITEEAGLIGSPSHASNVSYLIDPFDRSRPFVTAIKKYATSDNGLHRTLADVVEDPAFVMQSLEAPFGSITCVRDGELTFNAMLNYTSGTVYVACRDFIGYGNIAECPDAQTLADRGVRIGFQPRSGQSYVCFTGDPLKDEESSLGNSEHSRKYQNVLKNLHLQGEHNIGPTNPGGPARVLYLSDFHDDIQPSFILANGEKLFEFLGWMAFAVHSQQLAVFELYSDVFEGRNLILHAPPPNYSAFTVQPGSFRLDIERILRLSPVGHYRGAVAITHARSTVARAFMTAMKNGRELYHPLDTGSIRAV